MQLKKSYIFHTEDDIESFGNAKNRKPRIQSGLEKISIWIQGNIIRKQCTYQFFLHKLNISKYC